jgi:hypothetical protein
MKSLFILMISLFIYSCHKVNPDQELKMKTEKVRARLISGKPLPERIRNLDALTFDKPDSSEHNFEYQATRTENGVVDSVTFLLIIRSDSLLHFSIIEQYFTNGKQGKSYFYTVNRYGVIDYAYRAEAPKDAIQPTPIQNSDGTVIVPMNCIPIDEIDFNSPDSILKNPGKKVMEMYTSRLKVSVDELYYILFKH